MNLAKLLRSSLSVAILATTISGVLNAEPLPSIDSVYSGGRPSQSRPEAISTLQPATKRVPETIIPKMVTLKKAAATPVPASRKSSNAPSTTVASKKETKQPTKSAASTKAKVAATTERKLVATKKETAKTKPSVAPKTAPISKPKLPPIAAGPVADISKPAIAVNAKTTTKTPVKPATKTEAGGSMLNQSVAQKLDLSKISIFGPRSSSYRYDPRMVRAMEIAQARAYGRSQGSCWRYVKNALLSAGLVDSRPTTAYAKEAAYELTTKYGFRKISCTDPYKAPIGSVLVYGGKGAGHVEFRTKSGFVSDFTTPRPSKRPLIGVYVK